MDTKRMVCSATKWATAITGIASGLYAAHAGLRWFRYGYPKPAQGQEADALLDLFMPDYEIADRCSVHIAAPAEVALSAATDMDLESSVIIRAIFKGREWILHSKPDHVVRPQGVLAEMKSLGWGVLAELPGREIVLGGVTKPWEANPIRNQAGHSSSRESRGRTALEVVAGCVVMEIYGGLPMAGYEEVA